VEVGITGGGADVLVAGTLSGEADVGAGKPFCE
jgi:hypothetical protein